MTSTRCLSRLHERLADDGVELRLIGDDEIDPEGISEALKHGADEAMSLPVVRSDNLPKCPKIQDNIEEAVLDCAESWAFRYSH